MPPAIKNPWLKPFQWLRRSPNKPPRSGVQKVWFISIWTFLGICIYLLAVDNNLFWLFGSSPSLQSLQKPRLELPSEVFSYDKVLVGKYYRENRSTIDYTRVSPYLVQALLSTEDIRFYEHNGIDAGATASILIYAIKGDNRGGSTLTQQLAKNLYKIRKKEGKGVLGYVPVISTIINKTKEWLTAIKLEQTYTKQEILTLYLNTVDFGSNSYGIKTAAKTFFSTTPEKLKVQEAAMLVGMLKATTAYNPIRNYKKAINRRNTVLFQMVKYKQLSQKAYDSLKVLPIELHYQDEIHRDGAGDYYTYEVSRVLNSWAEENDYDINSDGLKIYLTIDSRMQAHAQAALRQHLKELQKRFDNHWTGKNPWCDDKGVEIPNFIENLMRRTPVYKKLKVKYGTDEPKIWADLNTPKPKVMFSWAKPEGDSVVISSMDSLRRVKKMLHAGLLSMDPFTGHIKAWVGGIDWKYFQFDHVKQSRRQPGSTFKAIVYAAAMDKGYSPCFKLQDKYLDIKYDEDSSGIILHKNWKPNNAVGYFTGMMMSLRHGIGRSINSIAAQVCMIVGPQTVMDYARKLGISSPLKPLPAIALGSYDVNLFEMVGAYSAFVNKGIWIEPIIVNRIEDNKGNVLKLFTPKTQKALSPEAAWLMIYMLKGTLQEPMGTAQALFSYNIFRGNEMAGKTGTSQNQSDGWFIGFSKDLVTGVWTGADERSIHFRSLRMGEGSKSALPIFGLYYEKLYADKSIGYTMGYFPKPSIPIKAKYLCPTYYPKKDTASIDSTKNVDSTGANSPVGAPEEEVIK